MTLNKKDHFEASLVVLSDFAKSLGHPARLAILREIARKGECICGDIVDVLPLAQSTVSQHLKELKKAGLIKGSINGPKSCYCINWDTLEQYADELRQFFHFIKPAQIDENCACDGDC